MAVKVAVIGCGFIGRRRAGALPAGSLALACDLDSDRARAVAQSHGAATTDDWRAAVAHPHIDAVVVATTHDLLAEIATAAARNGKHVLLEKPGARRASELEELAAIAARGAVTIHVGFNHRYHPAMQRTRLLLDEGAIGSPLFVRARYGHGGRPGYEREWRADPARSGGGEAIDQGSHLIDLAQWYLGDLELVRGLVATYYWDMPVEDNVFALLRGSSGRIAQLHASWTEWRNLFSFELVGKTGKLEISGLGGSYGVERLTYYRMLPEMGPPETTIWEYPQADDSWRRETAVWLADLAAGRPSSPGVGEARSVLHIIERIYAENAG